MSIDLFSCAFDQHVKERVRLVAVRDVKKEKCEPKSASRVRENPDEAHSFISIARSRILCLVVVLGTSFFEIWIPLSSKMLIEPKSKGCNDLLRWRKAKKRQIPAIMYPTIAPTKPMMVETHRQDTTIPPKQKPSTLACEKRILFAHRSRN